MTARLGVCSWSLRAPSPEELVTRIRECGVSSVQLALDPISAGAWNENRTRDVLSQAGITIRSGMMATLGEDYSTLDTIRVTGGVRPDSTWRANLESAARNAALAQRLGIKLVTFHAGFLPHDPGDAGADALVGRLCILADIFARRDVQLAYETGQEDAATLRRYLDMLGAAAGVNFDPANMILYGMGDPVASLQLLAPYVRQIHIKDATPAKTPGTWGNEVRVGTGSVVWETFFNAVGSIGRSVDLMIEREAGESRVDDIRAAATLAREHAGRVGLEIA